MKRLYYVLPCILTAFALNTHAQDFSNKGKDFWVAYTGHVDGTGSRMALYITSDQNASGTVSVAGNVINFTVVANQVTTVRFTNTSSPSNIVAYNGQTVGIGANKGIHIIADRPVVVYSHILNSARSGSTLVLPTTVLGREYYVSSYKSSGNGGTLRRSQFAAVATEDNTTLEITPTVADADNTYKPNMPFQILLNKGDVFQYQSANDNDLTGSHIKSIATPTNPCKPIAVFSGSTWTGMGCTNVSSGDNLYQQLFPFSSWGKVYYTAPFINRGFDIFRIIVQDPATVVTVNGVALNTSGLIGGRYYEINTQGNNTSRIIVADKPICIFQYMITQDCDGVNSDPEMIILNSIEQTLSDITVMSARRDLTPPNTNITSHFLNIIFKTNTFNTLKIDGFSPSSVPVAIPGTGYSYIQENVTASTNVNPAHRIVSDSGFICIAYGYGNVESYGYNAGTNLKDLYQFVSIQNQYATVNFPSTCKNTPFFFSMTFPYQPTQIKWVFGAALNSIGINDVTINSPVFDSTWVVNGKSLYRYKLSGSYSINTAGTYPIKVIAQNPTPDGCSGEQEINYDVQVFDPPVANFNFTTTGCVSDSVRFTDNSNTAGRPAIKWFWNFDNGQGSQIRNPAHLYTASGTYNVKFAVVTDIGCISDTATKQVMLSEPPVAYFGVSAPACIGKTITISDSSATATSSIIKWTWNFGDGSPAVVSTTNALQTHSYTNTGSYTITLQVENAGGCKSLIYSRQIIVSPNPTVNFTFGKACLPTGAVQFTDASTISDGTQSSFTYVWSFGDGGRSALKNPSHIYAAIGPYSVSMAVASGVGCVDSIRKVVDSIYAQPQANFTTPAEVCFGTTINFTDQSSAPNSTTTGWQWDFGDGTAPSNQQNPVHNYAAPGTYTVSLVTTSAVGCVSAAATKPVVVNALPVADFAPSVPSCVTKTNTFTNTSIPNSGAIIKWTWNFGDGSPASNQQTPTHTYPATGTYNVTLQVETDKGCISTITSKPVVISPLPVPGFIMPGNCVNDPISQFTDISSIADGSQNSFTYLWNFGDANATAANPNTSTLKNATHKFIATGDYNVTLTVTSGNGCSSSITQVFTINGAVPVSAFVVQNGPQHCSNDSIRITDNSSVNPGRLVKLEIYWDFTGDPTNKTVINNPVPRASYSHLYPEFFTPATKVYVVNIVAYSGINCLSSFQQTVTIKATPDIIFNAVAPVCSNESSFQLPVNVPNMTGGNGVFSGTGISSTGTFNPSVGAGIYLIRYTYTALNGCSNFKEQNITISPVPKVSAGPDKFVLEGGSAILNGSSSGNGLTYLWSPGTYLNNPGTRQPVSIPLDDITYTLTVISSEGCSDSDQVFVKVLKSPTIPNVFTPNGDGINDTWVIQYLESYPGATVEIFNRYGSLVYRSVGYIKSWNGTYGGKQMPAGTYYYIINPKNGRKQITGFVDIVR